MNTSATPQPELKQYDVAIVGAGLAGSLCAEKLTAAGMSVCVIDKSRGSGGRASSKRINDAESCELGTPFVLASQTSTQALFQQLHQQNLVSPWQQAQLKRSDSLCRYTKNEQHHTPLAAQYRSNHQHQSTSARQNEPRWTRLLGIAKR